MNWPDGVDPNQLGDLESQARALRYQALGKACQSLGIRALFTAHHLDDNIETVLLRLTAGQRSPLGLRGMGEIAHIPECHGMYGVAESGEINYLSPTTLQKRLQMGHHVLPTANGGVFLFRPFLRDPKSKLLATCRSQGIPFVDDPSNSDITYTERNTVRYLLSSGVLPGALQAPSIMGFIEKCRNVAQRHIEDAKKLFDTFDVLRFDASAGTVLINFPYVQPGSDTDVLTQALALRQVLDVVSPAAQNATPPSKLRSSAEKIFSASTTSSDAPLQSTFTIGGVKFEPVQVKPKSKSFFPGKKRLADYTKREFEKLESGEGLQPNTWLLTRQLFSKKLPKPVTTFKIHLRQWPLTSSLWSQWQLWDNRFWIRVCAERTDTFLADPRSPTQGHTPDLSLVVRPLEEHDIPATQEMYAKYRRLHRQLLPQQELDPAYTYYQWSALLKASAPGRLRFTLPIIAEEGDPQRVYGVPTIGKGFPIHYSLRVKNKQQVEEVQHWQIKWSVVYKHFEPEFHNLLQ